MLYIVLHVCTVYTAWTWRGPIRPKPQLCISEMRNLCLYWVTGQRYSEPLFRNLFWVAYVFITVFGPRYWVLRVSTYRILKVLFLVAFLVSLLQLFVNQQRETHTRFLLHLAPPNVCFCVQEPQRSVNYCTFLIHVLLNCDLVWNGFRLRHLINKCLQSVARLIKYSQSVAL